MKCQLCNTDIWVGSSSGTCPDCMRRIISDQERHDKMHDLIRALVYKDHLGRGWWAYGPTDEDHLDAGGSIPSAWFATREEAEGYVRQAVEKAVKRPRDTALDMEEL